MPEEQWTSGEWRVATVASRRRGSREPMAGSVLGREKGLLSVVVLSATSVRQCVCSEPPARCVSFAISPRKALLLTMLVNIFAFLIYLRLRMTLRYNSGIISL
jgi:hypothetical protein